MAQARLRGDRVAELRRSAGWLQADLAARLGNTEQRVGEWERGVQQPQPRHLTRLAEALGVAPLNLLDVDQEDPPLRALRLAAGLTLHQIAAASGIAYSTYHRLENGVARDEAATAAAADALASPLGVSAARVLRALTRSRAERRGSS